jgi:hypothetical protein
MILTIGRLYLDPFGGFAVRCAHQDWKFTNLVDLMRLWTADVDAMLNDMLLYFRKLYLGVVARVGIDSQPINCVMRA